jgi:sarcosine oxidase
MSESFDCIVIGLGGFGSGTFYHLAKRGVRVLGIEQFGIAHAQGSSHGETRIIRQAYFEHPDYVPLAKRAYDLWRQLEAESGRSLMKLTGVLLAGPPNGEAVGGAKLSAKQHGLLLEEMSPKEAEDRFRGLRFADEFFIVHEPDAGYLFVERCVETHLSEARKLGGVLKTNEAVTDWSSDGRSVRVRTHAGEYEAASLVITAGPWAGELLEDLKVPLKVLRKPVFWSTVRAGFENAIPRWPGFLFELPEGVFYGLPGTDGASLKLAEHTGGQPVQNPAEASRDIDAEDQARIAQFIEHCVPAATAQIVRHNVCFYTMTPDAHFLIDRHPQSPNVVFGAGFSGHGFKFTGVLGQALADLAMHQSTPLPVDFLSLSRSELTPRTEQQPPGS